jgi:hypothetical protein
MKKFIKTILLILSILLIVNAVLDCVFTRILRRTQTYPYKEWNCIIQDSINANLLIMGSSRAVVQYDPRIIDSFLCVNAYNLGLYGCHVERQIVKYKVYHHYQKKETSFILFNFDFWGNWQKSEFQREQYFPYLVNPYIRGLLIEQEHFGIGELFVPMYRYYGQGILTLVESFSDNYYGFNKECWYKGYYYGMPSKWEGLDIAKTDTIRFNPLSDVVNNFDNFLSDLQKDSVMIIFVSSPIYSGITAKTVNLSEFYDFRNYFSEKYDIPVLDYISDTLCSDTAYFYNATHLNKTGAELFTTKLCHDLESLGIIRN